MSSYNVNGSVPKTMVRLLVQWYTETHAANDETRAILSDILDTPVSPELTPTNTEGESEQATESIVGPYELHDVFLYYHVRYGYRPPHVLYLVHHAFKEKYDIKTIAKWLRVFYTRFVTQQFKRDVAPPGPKLGSVTFSPRGDFRCPPDVSGNIWKYELDKLLSDLGISQ